MSTTTVDPAVAVLKYNAARYPEEFDSAIQGVSWNTYNELSMAEIDLDFLSNQTQVEQNNLEATILNDGTSTYFNSFDADFSYDNVLYSGVKRSTGTQTGGFVEVDQSKVESKFEHRFMPNYDSDSDLTYTGVDDDGNTQTFNFRGKFGDQASFESNQSDADGVIEFKTFKFKDGIVEAAVKEVDLEHMGLSGIVTTDTLTSLDNDERNPNFTSFEPDGSKAAGGIFFEPDGKGGGVDTGEPTDDFTEPDEAQEEEEEDDTTPTATTTAAPT
tara:strand:- start:8500 stop:9315 length:816 start_codon:yes stop_codon:yes gene_type:complete